MSTILMTGDTVRVKGTFREYAPVGTTGTLVDPDGNSVSVKIYNEDLRSIGTGTATRDSQGLYHYDWTLPTTEGIFFIEFKGLVGTKPQLNRKKVSVRFRAEES